MSDPSTPHAHGRLARSIVAITASFSLLLGLGIAVTAVRWVQLRDVGTGVFTPTTVSPSAGTAASSTLRTGACSTGPCNYLLLGSDSRASLSADQQGQFGTNQDIGGSSRADTIMLVHTDPSLQKAIIVSFPRDLWVEIPGHGMNKINSAFEGGIEGGGAQQMADTVTNLTGIPIDHYLYVDLGGFEKVVDTLGGVNMCIPTYDVNTPGWLTQSSATGETQVYYSEPGHVVDPNTGLDVLPGCQHLDGSQSLAFVRTRHLPCDAIGDFSRIGRQQQFLRAVINQMLEPQQLVKATGLVEPILRNMRRDQGLLPGDLVYLVGQLRGISTGAAEFRAVSGVEGTEGGLSVVRMDPSAQQIFDAIAQGKPLGDIGTQLAITPPSPANIEVAVIDDSSEGKADGVEQVLTDSGFDITPGIWGADKVPARISGTATIVFRPGHDVEAGVVSSYFPGVKVVESTTLQGVPVAIVVTKGYTPQTDSGQTPPAASACPAA